MPPFNVGVYQDSKAQALDQPASMLNKPENKAPIIYHKQR